MIPKQVRVVWWVLLPAAVMTGGIAALNWRSVVERYLSFRLHRDPGLLLEYAAPTAELDKRNAATRFAGTEAAARYLIERLVEDGPLTDLSRVNAGVIFSHSKGELGFIVARMPAARGANAEFSALTSPWNQVLQTFSLAIGRPITLGRHPGFTFEIQATSIAVLRASAVAEVDPRPDPQLLQKLGPYAIAFRRVP